MSKEKMPRAIFPYSEVSPTHNLEDPEIQEAHLPLWSVPAPMIGVEGEDMDGLQSSLMS